MDDKKNIDRPREQWGAAESEEKGSGLQASGEVRGARDLSDWERGELLQGYTAVGDEERSEEWDVREPGADWSASEAERRAGEFGGGGVNFGTAASPLGESPGTVASAKEKVREKASEAKAKVAQSARAQVDQRKGEVADRLEGLPGQLQEKVAGKAEEFIGQFASMADEYVNKATHLLREKDSDELLRMAKQEFRSRPLAVAAGFFALGFVGARLLRS
ncbi:MAG: hypothetical protein M3Y59_18645 [Myxococcota bacterium]|nr:hypothetical protein [Myxococcota bacterium]